MVTATETKYLSCAETAKVVRCLLTKNFPGIKFSVRSSLYSGGSSISIGWILGPTTKQVDKVAGLLASRDFDGMIDMEFHYDHWWKPNGEIGILSSPGSQVSRGVYPSINNKLPEGATPVHFGAGYIQTSRSYAATWEEENKLKATVAEDMCKLQRKPYTGVNTIGLYGDGDTEQVSQHAWRLLNATAFKPGETYKGLRYATDEERERRDWDNWQVFVIEK